MAELRSCNPVAVYWPFLFDTAHLQAVLPAHRLTFTRPRAIKTFVRLPAASKPRSIGDVIAELRATPEGNAAWQRAQAKKVVANSEAVAQGKLSKVKYYRIQKRITQRDLAHAMDTKQSNISRYERPSYKASRGTLEKLAAALGVAVADLV